MAGQKNRSDPRQLLEFVVRERIERVFLPFPALVNLAEAASGMETLPLHLCDVISTGEQLRICPAIVEFFEGLNGCRLHNHYSLSETQVAAAYTLAGLPRSWPMLPPIGQPIQGVEIHLLDSDLRPVAPGTSGQIYIEGECLAQGYLHRPQLTAERFLIQPVDNNLSARLFRTGDVARRMPDGNLVLLGRSECQVEISGSRVEPAAIDTFLLQHPRVRACVTVGLETGRAAKKLRSYIVPRDSAPREGDLRKFLRSLLPKYMIPSFFSFLDALPMTPNGRVDRHRLPQ